MIRKCLARIWVIICLISTCAHANVTESNDIRDLLKFADEETLVVCDVDDTLMEVISDFGSDKWVTHEIEKLMKQHGWTRWQAYHEFTPQIHKALMASKIRPVEPTTAETLYRLQKRGIKILGLTARYTELAYPTLDQLYSIDIDFAANTVYHTDIEVPGEFAAKFIEGVVFIGFKNNKGKTLLRFLDTIGYQPKKVVFIDDKSKHVQSVESAMEERKIPCISILYSHTYEKLKNFNPSIAEKQGEFFNKVIPDNEARKLLNSSLSP